MEDQIDKRTPYIRKLRGEFQHQRTRKGFTHIDVINKLNEITDGKVKLTPSQLSGFEKHGRVFRAKKFGALVNLIEQWKREELAATDGMREFKGDERCPSCLKLTPGASHGAAFCCHCGTQLQETSTEVLSRF